MEKNTPQRPGWDEFFMTMAAVTATRATCRRARHGAIIAVNNSVVSHGYNGAPVGADHCTDLGICAREAFGCPPGQRYEICRSIHSEMNALVQAAKHGVSVQYGTMYVTGAPCMMCARAIIQSGLSRVVWLDTGRYKEEDTGLSIIRDSLVIDVALKPFAAIASFKI